MISCKARANKLSAVSDDPDYKTTRSLVANNAKYDADFYALLFFILLQGDDRDYNDVWLCADSFYVISSFMCYVWTQCG